MLFNLFWCGTFGQADRHVDSRRFRLCPPCSRNGHWLQRPWTSSKLLGGSNAGGSWEPYAFKWLLLHPAQGWVMLTDSHREDKTPLLLWLLDISLKCIYSFVFVQPFVCWHKSVAIVNFRGSTLAFVSLSCGLTALNWSRNETWNWLKNEYSGRYTFLKFPR